MAQKSARELELEKKVAELEGKLAEKPAGRALSIHMAKSGGVSVYGLGRFPTTLYKEQWLALADLMPQITEFIKAHDGELKAKGK